LPDLVRSAGRKGVKIASMQAVVDEAGRVARSGAQYLFHDDRDYPAWLSHIENPPPILMVKGHRELLARPAVAIVGARNASGASNRFARILSAELAEAGFWSYRDWHAG
jgi:DNA processing protein